MELCNLCPRRCGVDRSTDTGLCGGGRLPRVARAALHMWEEPCISGTRGSGTVFFSGCPLGCVFCQNHSISHENYGAEVTVERLSNIFLELQQQGAHNINLVSPTPYIPQVAQALRMAKPRLCIPVLYNTGGYELAESLQQLEGLVDIYLPDLKYMDSSRADCYSGAPDYPQYATTALAEMVRQTGSFVFDGEDILLKGTVVRHLVLPAGVQDSLNVVRYLAQQYGGAILISLMSQYTPQHYAGPLKELHRPVSSYEYNKAVELAAALGLQGFMQDRTAAKQEYTPDFDLQGILPK